MTYEEADPLQSAKAVVLDYYQHFDTASADQLNAVLARFVTPNYHWRGLHPFGEITGPAAVVDQFWKPLRTSLSHFQRRPDVFLAGRNSVNQASRPGITEQIWVCQMGHYMGLFDRPWLDIPATGRMVFIRYAEFHHVTAQGVAETALFFDLISLMRQAGQYPLPPSTGASFLYPGPKTHDGLLFDSHDAQQGHDTLSLIDRMIADLEQANQLAAETGNNTVPREVLARCWHEDMIWYGPDGIGASYTIDRYQQQHQYPFRYYLSDKRFNGHVARFAEGNYGCFFGWPNLTNKPAGGFLGLPGSNTPADMRVVDVYRRAGSKLVENWVLIDLPHWLAMQGLDILARMRQLLGIEKL
ncbi:MAG: nuclear transport factor 2 family protein [Granulosicoccus sp.]|nr:nuclear transport factor 2 family protein [Granulosicoccus sp.]